MTSLSFKKSVECRDEHFVPFCNSLQYILGVINSSYLIPFFHSDPMDHVVNKLMWLE